MSVALDIIQYLCLGIGAICLVSNIILWVWVFRQIALMDEILSVMWGKILELADMVIRCSKGE